MLVACLAIAPYAHAYCLAADAIAMCLVSNSTNYKTNYFWVLIGKIYELFIINNSNNIHFSFFHCKKILLGKTHSNTVIYMTVPQRLIEKLIHV